MDTVKLELVQLQTIFSDTAHLFIKNDQQRYCYANDLMATDVALDQGIDVAGLSDNELIWQAYAAGLQTNDRIVRKIGKRGVFTEPVVLTNNVQLNLQSYKIPLVSPRQQAIGVLGLSFFKDQNPLLQLLSHLQCLCIQQALKGLNRQAIARACQISLSMVSMCLGQACQRLSCDTVEQLLQLYGNLQTLFVNDHTVVSLTDF